MHEIIKKEILSILQNIPDKWNTWRKNNADKLESIHHDCNGLDFSQCDLSGLNLSGLNFRWAVFTGAYLKNTDFTDSILIETLFDRVNAEQALFIKTRCDEMIAREALFIDADFTDAQLTNANFERSMMNGALLRHTHAANINLTAGELSDAVIEGADFTGAVLHQVDLTNTVLINTNFSYAEMTDANFIPVENESLRGINLTGVNLLKTHIRISLIKAKRLHIKFDKFTRFPENKK